MFFVLRLFFSSAIHFSSSCPFQQCNSESPAPRGKPLRRVSEANATTPASVATDSDCDDLLRAKKTKTIL